MHYILVDENMKAYGEVDIDPPATICIPPSRSALTDVAVESLEAQGIVIDMSALEEQP